MSKGKKAFFCFVVFITTVSFTFCKSSIISYGKTYFPEDCVIEGESLWDDYYEAIDSSSLFITQICDVEENHDDEFLSSLSYFTVSKDDYSSYPKSFPTYITITDVSDFAFQLDDQEHYIIATRGNEESGSKIISVLIDLTDRKIVSFKKASFNAPDYANVYYKTALSPSSALELICVEFDYAKTEFGEGTMHICFIPEYGFCYFIAGGYLSDNEKIFDRVEVLMHPFTGEILASMRVPYSSY